MSDKLYRGNCQKCGTAFMTPIGEIPLHVVEPGIILCWKCCREEHWYEEQRCGRCSEKTCCKGLFLSNLKNGLKSLEGV